MLPDQEDTLPPPLPKRCNNSFVAPSLPSREQQVTLELANYAINEHRKRVHEKRQIIKFNRNFVIKQLSVLMCTITSNLRCSCSLDF